MFEPNPSIDIYNNLHIRYPNTIRCPCTTMSIPYERFIKLSATFHHVCSSYLISEVWLSILKYSQIEIVPSDWRNSAWSQFQLLADLCQLANQTVNDTVNRFHLELYITSNVMHENDFNQQINVTIDRLFRSLPIIFAQFVKSTNLFMQIDQPFNEIGHTNTTSLLNLISRIIKDEDNPRKRYEVPV